MISFYEFQKILENSYVDELFESDNSEFIKIALTPAEKDAADWAIDPMEDSKDELFGEDAILPRIEGNFLVLHKNKDVLEDLIYRLTEQAKDMYRKIPKDHEHYDAVFIKAGKSLAKKLKKIVF